MKIRRAYDVAMIYLTLRREVIAARLRRVAAWCHTVASLYQLHRAHTVIDRNIYPRKGMLQALRLAIRQAAE